MEQVGAKHHRRRKVGGTEGGTVQVATDRQRCRVAHAGGEGKRLQAFLADGDNQFGESIAVVTDTGNLTG